MKQVWTAILGVLSVVALGCVAVVGPEVAQVGPLVRQLFGTNADGAVALEPARQDGLGPPPAAQGTQGEGALDLVVPEWMTRQREPVHVRFPGGRTQTLPYFTRVPPGIYMLEFSSPTYTPVLCQAQVNPRSRTRVTFGGQNCRVELHD